MPVSNDQDPNGRCPVAQTTATTAGAGVPHLRREVGFVALMFVSLGSIIGSGWLLGALGAAQTAGPASLIAWILAGIMLALLALVHAELGAAYPVSGGTARFPHFAFGSIAGFTCGWMAWMQAVTIAPIEVEAALEYTNNKIPGLIRSNATLTAKGLFFAVILMLIFTAINIMGVKLLAETNTVTVIWKTAVPVLTIVVLIALSFNKSNFTGTHGSGGFAPFGAHGIFAALPAGVVFALQGFEQAIQMGGEAKNPQKDIARAVITAMIIGTSIYILLEVAFIGALHPNNLLHGWANPIGKGEYGPYATLASGLGASWLAAILYVDAFISPAGTGLIYVGTSSRLSYALGRNRYVPPIVAQVSDRGVPLVSILIAAVVGLIAFLPFPSWQSLVGLVTSATAIMYGFAPPSLGALRRTDPEEHRPFRLRGAWLISPLAFISANYIVYWSGWTADKRLFLAIIFGFILFGLYQALGSHERPITDWRASFWVAPWLGGLALITWLGQFGGRKDIGFWWDLALLAVFSVAIYELAVRLSMDTAKVHQAVQEERLEAAVEPELTVA
jgi:amino acid transporter